MKRNARASLTWGQGLKRTALVHVATVVSAPIPNARVSTAVSVKPGDMRSWRTAYRKSWPNTLRLTFFRQLLELVLRHDLAAEQVPLALGVLGKTRIVRHHADGRAFAVQVGKKMHDGFAI